jgi:hypothetical protein
MRKRKSSGTDGLAEGQWWGNGFQSDDGSAAGPEKGGPPDSFRRNGNAPHEGTEFL